MCYLLYVKKTIVSCDFNRDFNRDLNQNQKSWLIGWFYVL